MIYIDAFEAHKGAITQLYYEEDSRLLITGGKDKALRVFIFNLVLETSWKMDKWRNRALWGKWNQSYERLAGYAKITEEQWWG
jgi:hypothetical protein